MRKSKHHYIIGIDEVGRGPLAGPVTVGAVLLPLRFTPPVIGKRNHLRDSKRLSVKRREAWFSFLKKSSKKSKFISYAVSSVPPHVIDRINITRAANKAATQAFLSLYRDNSRTVRKITVFLDGGLFLDTKTLEKIGFRGTTRTIIRGDEQIPAIQLASIAAKVTRDRYMTGLSRKYPRYGFEVHKGYGTKAHRTALRKLGSSRVHRKTFVH